MTKDSTQYGIAHWGGGYFHVNGAGHLVAHPQADGVEVDLYELALKLRDQGMRFPVLVRFSDLLRRRVVELVEAFSHARQQHGYDAPYTAVYPIKVNQERHVIREIVRAGIDKVGLEAGSKPELLAVLGLARKGSIIICNGYKDPEYIRLALTGKRLGYRIYLVVEKLSELAMLLEEAEKFGVMPYVGIRMRLASVSSGKWQNTGGEKSKFGLSAAQLLSAVQMLKAHHRESSFQLLHCHLGSQIANIRDIQHGLMETGRVFAEARKLGMPINTIDVGGGLGVDYEGTHSRSDCSINYSFRQYADVIVRTLKEICSDEGLPRPAILSESGRAMTAHHAVLITDVIDKECADGIHPEPPSQDAPAVLQDLWRAYCQTDMISPQELHADVVYWRDEAQAMFNLGVFNLIQRAQAEALYLAICHKIRNKLVSVRSRGAQELADTLAERLADRMFINLSVFQSLPDIWAIDQIFPVVPLSRLNEKAGRRAVLRDLTCDSDGRIDRYVTSGGIETTLPVHEPDGAPYLLGFFLVGAYQEILGDMHNLFGDTHAINISITRSGYTIRDTREGDSAEDLLRHVHIPPAALMRTYRRRLAAQKVSIAEQERLLKGLENGLRAYTYLVR